MKKLIMIMILAMTLVSCELLNPEGWRQASEYRKEKGRKCYETSSGYVYCEDTK